METQIGNLESADLEKGTLTICIGDDIEAVAGHYAVVPIAEYTRLNNIANKQLENESAELCQNIRSSVLSDWLDDLTRKEARRMWDSHETMDDNMRINAIKYIISKAKDAGYSIGIKKAKELFDLHCS